MQTLVVGHGRGDVDVSVLKLPGVRLTQAGFEVVPNAAGLGLGQDVYFLGFPYKMWGDAGTFLGGMPCAFTKKGSVSSLEFGERKAIHVDAINNEGFSGGPLIFYPGNQPTEVRIAGIVSGFRVEYENVLDSQGELTGMTVAYNTGFLLAYSSGYIAEIISAAARG